ncbi:glycosyltransferase family 39 protein [Streptomyces sp. ODS28]|uniref:glycosyltransferase family 39 protein n=1 Tax=Streptomyces sp. ODS28 TaxID=3136688 RepID=UPI0031F0C29F
MTYAAARHPGGALHHTRTPSPSPPLPPFARLPVLGLAAAFALVLLVTSGRFAYKGDELYFLIAGRHLSWGYADQPPLVPLLARLMETLAPGSPVVLRLPVTLAVPLAAVVTALTARELGGGRRAQFLAAATFLTAPQVLNVSHNLVKRPLELCLCAVMLWLLVRWVRARDDRLWPAIGLVTALALQNNYLIGAFWAAAALAIAATGPREVFRRPLMWAGAAIVAVSLVPGLLWQAAHGWPQLAMGSVIGAEVASESGRLLFVPLVFLAAGLVGSALFCSGLWWLLRSPGLRPYRFLGWTVLLLAVLICAVNGKRDYLAAMSFPLCWAVAAVQVERHATARLWRWLPTLPALALSLLVCLRGLLPLQVDWMWGADRYLVLTRDSDWHALSAEVAAASRDLPPDERKRTVVIAGDYWRASALEWLRPEYRLPPVYGDMRGSWYFGTPPATARTVVYVGPVPGTLRRHCGELRRTGAVSGERATTAPGTDADAPVSVCSDLRTPLPQLWPALHHLELHENGRTR